MFRLKQRRATAAMLAVSVGAASLLAACGRSSDSEGEPTAATTIASGPATGTITIWAQGIEGEELPGFAKDFEAANPDVTIEVTALPWDAAHNKYQTAIAGGTTPDIAMMGTTWMGDFADAFVPTPTSIDTSVFFPGSVKSTVVGGTAYGVPWGGDTRIVYYRKDLLAKAGYDTFPTTFDDFKALAKAFQTEAGAEWGVALPVGGADSFQSMLFMPWSSGAELTNEDQTEWTLDTPEWVEAMEYFQSFFTEGIANPNPDTGAGAQESAFVDGSIPMFVAGPSGIASLSEAGGPGFEDKVGVAMVPKDVSASSFIGGSNLVVFQDSENQGSAWKFIQWLSEPEVQVKWFKTATDLPTVESAWEDPALADDPYLSVFGEQLKSGNSPPQLSTWTQLSAAADTVLEQIVKSGADPAEAMQGLQSTADSLGTGD